MSSLPSKEFFDLSFEKEDLVKGFKVTWFVINNSSVSFEIIVGSYNLSQNTFRLKNKFRKCIIFFIESLIADFILFFSAIANFYFCKEDWALVYVYTQYRDFTNISSFSRLLDNT